MKIAITGGTGFAGKEMTQLFQQQGHEVFILTRSPKPSRNNLKYVEWLRDGARPELELAGVEAFVNLAGSSINDGRWDDEQKELIYSSRVEATTEVLRIIRAMDEKPKVLINASAVGLYPASTEKTYTEKSPETGSDFLAKTVVEWERLANEAKEMGVRVACGRFGIILGKKDGALPLMALPYKLFGGGTVGSGRQWLSWVHVRDASRAILFAIETEDLKGPFNVTAPYPKRMKDFGKEIARALGRPHWFPVPEFALKMVLGDKSRLVLEGQRVLPTVLQEHGFEFDYADLRSALADIYK